ncbi:peptide/nickel transport system ATP-binding protein [Rhizobium skierniewicense]|uniref:Glutathione import ATP-binding protein GsiA n=1 Tax=Rhizobium skierniewicense TaxID=984260 RepID=A0A7W6CBN8_9HYPH|nr:ABC transporter ATP-binding protein [Rhizobium skierniewicense]MBB3948491.1 peptide/nickel transport system ATP-binding protein [Rhizobium skierniewicense]
MKSVDVKNLTISLGEGPKAVTILPNVSFNVEPGECFGLVGESGSGKSTILRCMSLLFKQWEGEIWVGNQSVRDMPLIERCRTVQMVFQDPYGSLHPRQSVRTVLSEPLRIHKMDHHSERMEQAITEVGLPLDFLDRYPHQLSGGQRQRVAIARALILEPSVLFLDEPTSALDVSVQAEILNLLSDLRARKGFTYIMVSHDLAVVDYMCDRFAVMQAGDIVEILDRDVLDGNKATHPYARQLIDASLRYDSAI